MKKIMFLLCFALCLPNLYAQKADKEKLDGLFDLIEEENQGMGRISVFKDGKEIYSRSYGYSDLAANKRADKNTKFRIASITKTFTAAVIMKLIEEGELTLDDKLEEYYPGLPNADKITIRNLLSHRTGYGRRLDGISQSSATKEEMFAKLRAYKGELGEYGTYQYGNMNFVLLTYIAEQVSGKTFAQLLDEIIIKPLKLKNTLLWNKDMAKVEAQSYRLENDKWILSPQRDVIRPVGAGGLLSTPYDINVYINALSNGKVITEESFQKMLPQGGYGLGMMPMNYKNIRGYGHNGVFGIYRSLLRYYPSLKLSIAITSNAMIYSNAKIADNVLSILLNEPDYQYPDFSMENEN